MTAYIANKVREAREKAELTQEDLALRVEVSRQTVAAIERGHYTPSVLLALRLARIFKVSVEDLFSIAYEK
ncbi:MAG TPA: helix-turn-helix transcriptional regulator [Candidatus Paceibacterota bacterium]